nr:hypothetical protein [Tanacetum cinerariifolium]
MGYEKPSTKLTFYKAFFSSQWKFLIHTILQSLNAKRTSWNEFSTAMASAVICLSKEPSWRFVNPYHTLHFPYFDPKGLANMRRVMKGFLGVETPLFEGMLDVRQSAEEGVAEAQVQVADDVVAAVEENVVEDDAAFPTQLQQVLNVCSALSKCVENLENVNATQKLEIVKLKARGRMIADMDMDEGIELVKDAEVAESKGRHAAQQPTIHVVVPTVGAAYTRRRKGVIIKDLKEELSLKTPAETPKKVVEVVTTAKLKTKVVTAAASQVSAISTTIHAASATIPAAKPTIPAVVPTVGAAYTRRRKGINKDYEEFSKDIDWDDAMDHVNQKSNNP